MAISLLCDRCKRPWDLEEAIIKETLRKVIEILDTLKKDPHVIGAVGYNMGYQNGLSQLQYRIKKDLGQNID